MQEAQAYVRRGKLRSAAIEYQRALQLDPHSAKAYLGLAQVELAEQNWPQAYAALRESLNIAPDQVSAELDLARLYLRSGEFTHAGAAARRALKLRKGNPAAHQVLAAAAAASHHPHQAQREFARVAALTPRDPNAWINLALSDAGLRHPGRAKADLRRALAIAPKAALAYTDLANLELSLHQPDKARQVLAQGLAADPGSVQLWLRQARMDVGTSAWRDDLLTLLARRPRSARAAVAASRFFAAQRDIGTALAVAGKGLRLHPGDEALEQQVFDCDLAAGHLRAAQALDAVWLRRDASNVGARLGRDRLLLRQGHAAAALPDLRALVQQDPGAASARYLMGVAEWQSGQRAQAVQDVSAALALQPDSPAMLSGMADMLLAAGNGERAQQYAERYARMRHGASGSKLLGRVAMAQSRDAVALRDFVAAGMTRSPQASDHALLAEAAAGAGQTAVATREFKRALALAPASSEIAGMAVHAAVQRGDWTTAGAVVAQFKSAAPHDAHGPWLAATVAIARRQWKRAAGDLHSALALQPGFVEADLDLGRIRQQTGSWQRAVFWYRQAARHEPKFAPLLTLIGNLYLERQQWDVAVAYYQRALTAQPDFALAAANLAWVKAEQNQDLPHALVLAQQADHEMPDVPSVDDTLAWVYYKLGSYGSALPLLRRCVSAAPNEPTYRFHFGMALMASGDKRAGARQLRRALALRLPSAQAKSAQRALAAVKG